MTKEELEKEARINLKRRFGEFFPQLTISYVMGAEPRERRIEELEKENAELKHTIATLRQEKDNVSMHAKAMEVVAKTRSDQLTKAKDHIKKLLGCLQQDTNDPQTNYYVVKYMTEAEQFLKESE